MASVDEITRKQPSKRDPGLNKDRNFVREKIAVLTYRYNRINKHSILYVFIYRKI